MSHTRLPFSIPKSQIHHPLGRAHCEPTGEARSELESKRTGGGHPGARRGETPRRKANPSNKGKNRVHLWTWFI